MAAIKEDEHVVDYRSRWAFWILTAFTMFVYLRPQEILSGWSVMGVQRIFGVAVLAVCLFSMRGRIQNLFTNRLFLFYFIYIGAILLSIPFSLWPGGSAIFLVDVVLKEAVILFAILVAIKNERQLILIFKLIVYCTTVVAVFTIVKYAGGQNLLAGYRASLAQGIFFDPNDLALHFVFSLPLTYFLMFRPAKRKLLPVCLMIVLAAAVLVTFSRGGMLGLLSVAAAIWYLDRERRLFNAPVILVMLIIAALLFPAAINRLSTLTEFNTRPEESMLQRWSITKEGVGIFSENPVLGVGLDSFSIAEGRLHSSMGEWKAAHNSFIQVAAETGIFGLVGFAGCLFLILKSRRMKQESMPELFFVQCGIRACTIGFIVCGTFLSQAYSWYFIYLIGFSHVFQGIVNERSGDGEQEKGELLDFDDRARSNSL